MISLTCRNYTLLHQTSCERWFSLFRWLLNAPQFLTVVGIVTILNWRIFFFFFCSIQETKGTTQSPFLSSNCDWFPYLSTFSQGYSRGILKDVCVCVSGHWDFSQSCLRYRSLLPPIEGSLTELDGDMKVVSMQWICTCTIFQDVVPYFGSNMNSFQTIT